MRVQFKAQRYFLGTVKYTPTDAVAGDMGWTPTFIRQYKCICNQWARYASMSENRVNKRILNYCKTKSGTRCQNWTYRVSNHFINLDCVSFVNMPQRVHVFVSIGKNVHGYVRVNTVQSEVAEVEINCARTNCLRICFKQKSIVKSYCPRHIARLLLNSTAA